jgi:inosose dehydratase
VTEVTGRIRLASAPVSFGVDEVQTDAWRPPPDQVLDIMAAIGFEATELGPPGYLGSPAQVRSRLTGRGLELAGSFLPLRFSRREHVEEDLRWLRGMTATILESAPPGSRPKAILADAFCEPDRLALTGRIQAHPEAWLPPERRRLLIDSIHRASETCRAAGLDPVVHWHAGTYIETDAEIRWVAEHIDPQLVGLCFDSGHARFGGADPVELVDDYHELIRLVHLKDCDVPVLEQVKADGGGLRQALERGAFCELGQGASGVDDVIERLVHHGYHGWLVVEQDRHLKPGETTESLGASQARNRDYLRRWGL